MKAHGHSTYSLEAMEGVSHREGVTYKDTGHNQLSQMETRRSVAGIQINLLVRR